MSRLPRAGDATVTESTSLRLRAAWLYHAHGLTQKDVAARLGIARTTVIRLLDEAARRGEVRIWISEGEADCVSLSLQLEERLGIDEVVVVPEAPDPAETPRAVGIALGRFLSETITDGMTVGVGWGRTLSHSLASFRPPRRENTRVVSLAGGVVEPRVTDPMEYTWRVASQLGAACFLYPAPLLVDSPETRGRLLRGCGLDRLTDIATGMHVAVVSAGDVGDEATSLSRDLLTEDEARSLVGSGAVADVLCRFLDSEGREVDHVVNRRVMSIGLDVVAGAAHRVIATGGAARAPAILAAHRRLTCNTLVTDEAAARRLLDLAG